MQFTETSSPVGTESIVEVSQLVKTYEHGDGVHGLDLHIKRGSAFGFLGPNGAGKSTTIKVLMGLLAPTSGTVSLFGESVQGDLTSMRQRVGYVPEQHFMYPWMSVGEIIWFTRSFYTNWDDAFCERVRAHYGLDPDKKVRELSHGMRTKLALVLALSHSPELLILDEPTTGLDPLIREEFLEGVNKLRAEQECTVLFSSHIMSDVETMADTIAIINAGKLLVCDSRDGLTEKTKRVCIAEGGDPPPGTIRTFREGDEWMYTVHGFDRDAFGALQAVHPGAMLRVVDLSLEEIFKDFIKGARGE